MKTENRTWGVMVPFIIVVILMGLSLGLFAYQALSAAKRESVTVTAEQLRYHVGSIDTAMSHVDEMLRADVLESVDLVGMAWSHSADEYRLYKYRVWDRMGRIIYRSSVVDHYFFYTHSFDDYMNVAQREMDYTLQRDCNAAVEKFIRQQAPGEGWYTIGTGENALLVRVLRTPRMTMGYWLRADYLLHYLPATTEGVTYQVCSQDALLADSGQVRTGERELVCQIPSETSIYAIRAMMDPNTGWHYLSTSGKLVIVCSVLILLACVGWVMMSYQRFLGPVNALITTMERIGKGDTEARVQLPAKAGGEICYVRDSFNGMMDQLNELRIHNLEQQLRLKASEMERLKLQINPHFFINVLNVIRSYAMMRNMGAIMEVTVYLAEYFRFVLQRDVMYVPLQQEMSHVDNYIRIQQFRFTNRLHYQTDVPEPLLRSYVPVLLVHTFVDNAVRYAMTSEEPTIIVKVWQDEERWMHLCVEDNGEGFSAQILEQLNSHCNLTDKEGNHVGIWNLKERMKLFFGDQHTITFSNRPQGGACIHCVFPYCESEVKADVPHADRG